MALPRLRSSTVRLSWLGGLAFIFLMASRKQFAPSLSVRSYLPQPFLWARECPTNESSTLAMRATTWLRLSSVTAEARRGFRSRTAGTL
jgi:hypothetical protein